MMRRVRGRFIGLVLGLLVGGPTGALVGFVIGFLHDCAPATPVFAFEATRPPRRSRATPFPDGLDSLQRSTYLIGIIVLSAKIAKSDGRVTRAEIDTFRRVFRIPDSEVAQIGALFDQARATAAGFEPYAARLAQVFRYHKGVLEGILSGLFQVALADTHALSPQEDAFLRRVGLLFGLAHNDFMRIAAAAGVRVEADAQPSPPRTDSSLAAAYRLLGLPTDADAATVKRTYHVLIRQNHPDKLQAQGAPASRIAEATEKMKRLNVAYADICKNRGLK